MFSRAFFSLVVNSRPIGNGRTILHPGPEFPHPDWRAPICSVGLTESIWRCRLYSSIIYGTVSSKLTVNQFHALD